MTDKYIIEVFYSTGDSYKTEDTSTELEMTWENKDNAKVALQRIREHWQWWELVLDLTMTNRKLDMEISSRWYLERLLATVGTKSPADAIRAFTWDRGLTARAKVFYAREPWESFSCYEQSILFGDACEHD